MRPEDGSGERMAREDLLDRQRGIDRFVVHDAIPARAGGGVHDADHRKSLRSAGRLLGALLPFELDAVALGERFPNDTLEAAPATSHPEALPAGQAGVAIPHRLPQ